MFLENKISCSPTVGCASYYQSLQYCKKAKTTRVQDKINTVHQDCHEPRLPVRYLYDDVAGGCGRVRHHVSRAHHPPVLQGYVLASLQLS